MDNRLAPDFSKADQQLKAGIAAAGDARHRITSLDGLRGIAIALVLIHHSADLPWPTEWSSTFWFKAYWHLAKSLWVVVSLVLARIAWTLVEGPFLSLRHKFKPQW